MRVSLQTSCHNKLLLWLWYYINEVVLARRNTAGSFCGLPASGVTSVAPSVTVAGELGSSIGDKFNQDSPPTSRYSTKSSAKPACSMWDFLRLRFTRARQ